MPRCVCDPIEKKLGEPKPQTQMNAQKSEVVVTDPSTVIEMSEGVVSSNGNILVHPGRMLPVDQISDLICSDSSCEMSFRGYPHHWFFERSKAPRTFRSLRRLYENNPKFHRPVYANGELQEIRCGKGLTLEKALDWGVAGFVAVAVVASMLPTPTE